VDPGLEAVQVPLTEQSHWTLALQLAIQHPGIGRGVVGIGTYAGWSGSFPADVVAQRLQRT
jgi:hypothetical protein